MINADQAQNRRHFLTGSAGILALGSVAAPAFAKTPALANTSAPAWLKNGMVDVRGFGAKGDGTTIDSPAINRAIDHVAAKGGGTVVLPSGIYASYTLRLKSKVTLYLSQGAVLLAAPTPMEGAKIGCYDLAEPQDPAIEAFQDYGHNHWRNSLIWGEGLHDIAILGEGLIWGKGLSRGHNKSDLHLPRPELPGVGNKAIALKNCFNVQLRDFQMLKCGHFALLATGVDNMTIDNLMVDTDRDGFDIDCCHNVRVSNCTVNSPYDDAICPKSSFALGYARTTENVTISNCYVSGNYVVGSVLDGTFKRYAPEDRVFRTGRIKCGTESNGGFKNITVTNCVFDECQGFALETEDGAILEDVAISNITMRGLIGCPLFLRLGRRMRGPKETPIGTLKRVVIDNIVSSGSSILPSILAGIEGHPVEDIKISNVYFEQKGGADAAMAALNPPANEEKYPDPQMFGDLPATGFFIRHARNVELNHVEIKTLTPDARPAFWLQDVDGFDIQTLRAPNGPIFKLDGVSNFRSWGHAALPDLRFDAVTSGNY